MFNLQCKLLAALAVVVGCGGDDSKRATASTSKPSVWDQYEKDATRGADGKKGQSASQVTVNGRQVKATADVAVRINFQGDVAMVKLDERTVAVDFGKNSIVVDEKEHAKLPAASKVVEVRFLEGKLTFSADGANIPAITK